jgi:hypothetical protein
VDARNLALVVRVPWFIIIRAHSHFLRW